MKLLIVIIAVTAFAVANGEIEIVSQEEFNSAVTGLGLSTLSWELYNGFLTSLEKANIEDKEEAAMALTHYLHESGLRHKREIRCLDNGCPGDYETPGCDQDGQRYYGRGFIQLTWCENYRQASKDLYGSDRLVQDPDIVAREDDVAWATTAWFWKVYVHSRSKVREGEFGASTRAINGPLECDGAYQHIARQRFRNYGVVRSAFGLSGAGDERGCYKIN